MTDRDIARTFHATVTAVRNGSITVEQGRARNRELRTAVGNAAYDRAKYLAVCAMNGSN